MGSLDENIEEIFKILKETGILEKILEIKKVRLRQCGWHEKVGQQCRKILEENSSSDNGIMTAEELVKRVTPEARALVPESIKKEIMDAIEQTLFPKKKK